MLPKGFKQVLEDRLTSINGDRREALDKLGQHIAERIKVNKEAVVKFVCTHNSRRSQLAEFMLDVLARDRGYNVIALSAGTESTAFNPRMVTAITSLGFEIEKYGHETNPLYIYKASGDDYYYYSKKYDEDIIPYEDTIIVTVCGDANENCPVIPGSFTRMHIGYVDPKASDNSPQEAETYSQKVLEIGSEMLYIINHMEDYKTMT